jgi:hypothetical protein
LQADFLSCSVAGDGWGKGNSEHASVRFAFRNLPSPLLIKEGSFVTAMLGSRDRRRRSALPALVVD